MSGVDDRRGTPRARFSGIVLVRAEGFEISCVAGDISETGMLLYPTRPPPVLPRHVQITFALPNSNSWLEVGADLVRQKTLTRRQLWAVRFVALDDETQDALRRFVAEHTESRATSPELPEGEPLETLPVPRTGPGERRQVAAQPAGAPELDKTPPLPFDARLADEEAACTDHATVMLSSDEVDQLAAASLVVNPESVPPPLPDDVDDEEDEEDEEDEDEAMTTVKQAATPSAPVPPTRPPGRG